VCGDRLAGLEGEINGKHHRLEQKISHCEFVEAHKTAQVFVFARPR